MSVPARRALAFAATAIAAAAATPALADDLWRERGEDCDRTAFKHPEDTQIPKVGRCVRLWEAYKDVSGVSGREKDLVVAAMRRLYVAGDDKDAHVAKRALGRLGVTDLPERPDHKAAARETAAAEPAAASGEGAPPARSGREKCEVPEPSSADEKKADGHVKKGLGQYKKKDYGGALRHYLAAVDAAPGWARGRYNAAAMYAIQDDEANAVSQLRCLADIESEDSVKYLKMARKDADFAPIRDRSAGFKEVTGYARIKIGNSLGDYGEDNVDNLEGSLEKLGYPVEEVTTTKKTYKEPQVWYKPECAFPAYIVVEVMNHPGTKTHKITWEDEPFDVIVAWGDEVVKGKEPRVHVRDPRDAEKKLDDIARKEDEMLRKPEAKAREIEHVVETPDRMTRKVEGGFDRAGKTVERLEKTGKKLEGLVP